MKQTQIVEYSITDAAIEKMKTEYMPLVIRDITDKHSYDLVHAARMNVKAHRVEVEKTRKELKADALSYGRKVDSEAKRITGLLEPIEAHLQAEEDKVQAEKDRIQSEKAAQEQARIDGIQAKIDRINRYNRDWSGKTCSQIREGVSDLMEMKITADEYQEFEPIAIEAKKTAINALEDQYEARFKLEQEDEARKVLSDRLEEIRKEQAAAQAKIDAENARLKAERDQIEAEKRAEEQRKREEEIARQAAERAVQAEKERAEKAERDRIAKAEKAEQDRIAKAKAEAEEAARQEALKPDLEKIKDYTERLLSTYEPELSNGKANDLLCNFFTELGHACKTLIKDAEAL